MSGVDVSLVEQVQQIVALLERIVARIEALEAQRSDEGEEWKAGADA